MKIDPCMISPIAADCPSPALSTKQRSKLPVSATLLSPLPPWKHVLVQPARIAHQGTIPCVHSLTAH